MNRLFQAVLLLSLLNAISALKHLEPVNGQILHCVGQANSDFSGAGGFKGLSDYLQPSTRPIIFMVYLPVNNPVNNMAPWFNVLSGILSSYGSQQFVGVQLGLWFSGIDSQVANGAYDDNIKALAEQIGTLQRPFWIRVGYEFNGEWNSYTRGTYQTAFQRFANLIRANPSASKYTALVWDFSADASSDRLDYMNWYPGDSYVDWWGVNVFSNGSAPNSPLVVGYAKDAKARGFPVMIGESTPRYVGALAGSYSWSSWYQPYFSLISNPDFSIKAFCYINWNWGLSPWPNWGDAEVEKNAFVGSHYQMEMNRDVYFHAGDRAQVLAELGIN